MSDGDEGSVFVEGVDDDSEETTSESEGSDSQETETQEGSDVTASKEGETKEQDGTLENTKGQEQDQKPVLTDKGTKLADDPLSAANQQLANERAKIRAYEEVLQNPDLLRGYVAQFDKNGKEVKKEESKEPEMRIEDIQTTEDLHKYERQQQSKLDAKMQELDSTIQGIRTSQQDTVVANTLHSDITTVRGAYPELDPKLDKDGHPTNPNYNIELDNAIGFLYQKFDQDPNTKKFLGRVNLKEIADVVMRAAGASKKQGTTEAQTTIRDKRTGKAATGGSGSAPDENSMTAGQLIASRIKAAKNH